MRTPGIQWLAKHGVPHTVITYDHKKKGAAFAAQEVGFPLSQIVKTLVVALDDNRHALALMPGDLQLSLKKLAAAFGAKRAAMADRAVAERMTGYHAGGISPFGTRNALPAVMDRSLEHRDEIMINAGRRGVMVKMLPDDILHFCHVKLADLARKPLHATFDRKGTHHVRTHHYQR
jgi:Cys-tRNA(Pro)/Cys-tRNA(Cys) deacylase